MIKVMIVEDELMAAARLHTLLKGYHTEIEVLKQVDSVKNAVQWLMANPLPDLIFMDIQLGDGTSFEIFEHVDVSCPVIFITAYNEYAIRAFKINSVDYLLKPLEKVALFAAMDKYMQLFGQPTGYPAVDMNALKALIGNTAPAYKHRFMVKTGEHLKVIPVADILYFFSRDKGTFAQVKDDRRHLLDYTMDQLEGVLDPAVYFRINRQFIICFDAIKDMISYTNSRIKVVLPNANDLKEIIVSREKVQDFKQWLDK